MAKTVVFVDTGLSQVFGGVHQTRVGREEPGAQLVAACCQEAGWNIRFLRPDSEDPDEICSTIREGDCDVVALFPYTYTKWLADEVAGLLKGRVPIVYGGYHVGVGDMPRKVLDEDIADYIIAGRGEDALPALLRRLESGEKMPPQVIRSRHLHSDVKYPLDRLPWMIRRDYLMQDIEKEPLPFLPPASLEKNPLKCVITFGSIGCSSRCDFCSSWMIAPAPLHRSPKNIVDEMIWLEEQFGPGLIYHIVDPLFNDDREWVMELCAEMEKRGPFPSVCLPDFCLDRQMVQAMKRAGFFMVMMGLEFASTELRVARGKRPGDPAEAYRLCSEEGIITRAFLMLGRLGMTREDLNAEVAALEDLPFRADQLRINFEVPFPGTKVARRLSPNDLVTDYPHWSTEEVVYRTGLTREEWEAERRKIAWDYHFCPRQREHYARQIGKFPELEKVYQDFLTRLEDHLSGYQ